MDCTKTDFPDNYFHTIFFDPPHYYGRKKNKTIFTTPSRRKFEENWPQHSGRRHPRYYGTDKYKNKKELLNFVFYAQKEFFRIINPSGFLWVKWSDVYIPLSEVITLFKNWYYMMCHYDNHPEKKADSLTYWLGFMKKESGLQTDLVRSSLSKANDK